MHINGSECSPDEILRRHAPLVLRLAWLSLGSRERSEEASRKVFLKLARSPRRFADEDALDVWLTRQTIRRATGRAATFSARWHDAPADADWALVADEKARRTLSVAGMLPPECRYAFYFRFAEGRAPAEIAPLLGRAARTAERDLARGESAFEMFSGEKFTPEHQEVYRAALAAAPVPRETWLDEVAQAMAK